MKISSINESYGIRMDGCRSRFCVVRVMDNLCQRGGLGNIDIETLPRLIVISLFLLVLCCFSVYIVGSDSVFSIDRPHYIRIGISSELYLSVTCYLYRFMRHAYFKANKLPGPYGWGTLDKEQSCYY